VPLRRATAYPKLLLSLFKTKGYGTVPNPLIWFSILQISLQLFEEICKSLTLCPSVDGKTRFVVAFATLSWLLTRRCFQYFNLIFCFSEEVWFNFYPLL